MGNKRIQQCKDMLGIRKALTYLIDVDIEQSFPIIQNITAPYSDPCQAVFVEQSVLIT